MNGVKSDEIVRNSVALALDSVNYHDTLDNFVAELLVPRRGKIDAVHGHVARNARARAHKQVVHFDGLFGRGIAVWEDGEEVGEFHNQASK